VSEEEIAASVPWLGRRLARVHAGHPGAGYRLCFHEALRSLFDWLVTGLVEGTLEAAAAAGVEDHEGVRRHPRRIAAFTAETGDVNRSLKAFLNRRVYNSRPLVEERERCAAMIARLFEFYARHPERLPAPYRALAADAAPHRVACDYIAGMTDGFFQRTYHELMGE
jgi:dGTPase